MKFGDNFLSKELVNTYAYTTATKDRDVCTYVSINGRRYAKFGTLQAVTFVGNLYKVNNEKKNREDFDKYALMIGMSKQHPCDTKVNKQEGYEVAALRAIDDPILIMNVEGKFDKYRFNNIVEQYLGNMKLEFIKTRAEIIADGDDPSKYNR